MDTITLKDALERHREQLVEIMERCELERERLQNELAARALQGESFEAMRPLHNEATDVTRDYWSAHGRAALIDQVLEALEGRRRRFRFDDAASQVPTLAAAERLGPWARCAEETCPPFPPWV